MQSKRMSLVESVTTTLAGGLAAFLANYFVLPLWWGLHPTAEGSLQMALFFGCMSVVIKYIFRRFFNAIR